MSDVLEFLSGSIWGNILGAVIILIIGLILVKILAAILRKALMRTRLDESVHKFIINVMKVVMYIVITAVSYTHLRAHET